MSGPEYFRRTAVTRLAVEADDHERLLSMVREWKRGCQIAVNVAWGVCHTRNEVQQLAYEPLRERTELGSQHAVLATHRAAEAIKRALERSDDAEKPEFTSPTVVYDSRTLTLFDDGNISLTTTGDRVRCRLVMPEGSYQSQYLNDDRWEPAKSTLHYRDGNFDLHLGFRRPRPEVELPTEDSTVLGVSLGVENLAVTSTAHFFSGGELAHRHAEFADLRADLRETDTRSARRTLRRSSERMGNFARNELHEVAGGIVSEAEEHGCSVIAFGELEGTQETLEKATRFHRRTFERLFEFVAYRAAERDITVVQVNPEYTSQRCTSCGFTHPQNRDVENNRFECLKCGNEANDDYNAAKNVGFRCIRRGPLSSRGVGAKYCALASGRVTPDGEFVPNEELEAVQKP
ncbi:transposase [Haladaptatus sp. R4]|uniref:RNA-guided endonuclease InsQ/TnpB family protein n=1 Tax=Haladaptatus sp. R4 TaxID=1679489 RepID=UPI0007B49F5F|nr:RNA-guided endonuclease TnpB family protein [Haladaptatus sp. R4]KZN25077.1 transposase [Haladaptatus sp. R4]